MLRLTFHAGKGDTPTLMLASFVRFCADGTLRGPDNYVVARCVEGMWHVGGRSHRELDCEGPVRVRITTRPSETPVYQGPFQHLRTVNGVLHADDACMNVLMPGRVADGANTCHELSFLPLAAAQTSTEAQRWPFEITGKPNETGKKPARSGNFRNTSGN